MGIFDKFKIGFKKSASALTSGLKEIIIKKEIDDKNLNKIEEFLIESDVGVEAASEIKEIISSKKIDPNKDLSTEINLILKEYIINLMKPLENNSFFEKKELFSNGFINEIIYSFKIRFISDVKSLLGSTFLVEIISFISEAASIPTSDWIKNSSILFKFSSSISFFTIISLRPDENAEALF